MDLEWLVLGQDFWIYLYLLRSRLEASAYSL